MGLKSTFKFLVRRIAEIGIIALIIIFVPNLPPKASISESYRLPPFKTLTGKLAINNKLDDVELWHKGDLHGPEVIIDHKGELYTSLLGGDIVKLVGKDHIVPVVKFGKPCGHYYEEKLCGRPLGLQFGPDGYLYAMDAYYGMWKVNVDTGEKELLISPGEKIDGIVPRMFNSIAVASTGEIYFSSSSSQFDLHDGIFDMLSDPSGRLIRFNPKTKVKTVLIDKMAFANGVVLSDDEEFVLVAETMKARILRYYLKGPKKGTYDIFADALPGLTDNLSRDGKGGFIVPLVMSTDEDHPMLNHILAPFPLVRRLLVRLMGIAQWVFQNVDKYYPNEFSQKAAFHIGHFTSIPSFLSNKRTTLLRLSRDGLITDSIHTMNKEISHLCDALIYKDTLFLGSFRNDYIAKIPLSKIGWEDLTTDSREKRDTKPVETAKKEPPVQEDIQKKQAPTKVPESQKPTPQRTETAAPPGIKEPAQQASQKQTAPPKVPTQRPLKQESTEATTQKPQREQATPVVQKTQKETVGSSKQAAATPNVERKSQTAQATSQPKQASTNSQNSRATPEAAQQNTQAAQQKAQQTQEKAQDAQQKAQLGQEKAQPAQQNAQPVQQKAQPAQQKAQPAQQKVQPAQQKAQPAQQKAQPAQQKAQPAQQKAQPAQQNAQPAQQKAQPAQQKAQPAQGNAQAAHQKPQPTQEKVQLDQHNAQAAQQKAQTSQQNAQKPQQKSQVKPEVVTQKTQTSQQKPQAKYEQPVTSQKSQAASQTPQSTQQKPDAQPEAAPRKPETVAPKSQTAPQKTQEQAQKPQTQQNPQSATSKESPPSQKPATPSKQPPPVAQPVKDQLNNIPINNGPKK